MWKVIGSVWIGIAVVAAFANAQPKRLPGTADESGKLSQTDGCPYDGDIKKFEVSIDLATVSAAHGKLEGADYSIDQAKKDASATCNDARALVGRLCSRSSDAGKVVIEKLKAIRCVVVEGSGAPQGEFKAGTWTVKYSLWSGMNELAAAKTGQLVNEASILTGLAKSLRVDPKLDDTKDSMFRLRSEATRCTSHKDCQGTEVCGTGGGRNAGRGSRCVAAPTPRCKEGGNAFGKADAACPQGHWCSMYGVCFPKSDFPVEGKSSAAGESCYYDRECASKRCISEGMNRFADKVGRCAR